MCGIAGIISFTEKGKEYHQYLHQVTRSLAKRGPDAEGFFFENNVGLGHRRLSIIDISEAANQPMFDESGRFVIVYNGEIFNFLELKKELTTKGVSFKTNSDTEVLLKLYIREGKNCLNKLNGFFAFAIYDKEEKTLFLARDRYGVKPLVYFYDENKFVFASEQKAILQFQLEKKLDYSSILLYLQLTYIPSPHSVFSNIFRLLPGCCILVKNKKVKIEKYYELPKVEGENYNSDPYSLQQEKLFLLLDDSVKKRLISDVPIGVFLSGGVDSSIITALASRHTKHLKTFSIGYNDAEFFDETGYANIVAKKFKTDHTVFRLSKDYILTSIFELLENIDEPFADPSSIAVFILSKHTRKHVTVALSGDGADEIFAGYNKHFAEFNARHRGFGADFIRAGFPLWKFLPKSRNAFLGNKIRQLHRFAKGMQLDKKERYWLWCCFMNEQTARAMIHTEINEPEFQQRKKDILQYIHDNGDFNEVLYTDAKFVLPNDMLRKVDQMSMLNSLEVRTPFLDYRVVDYMFSLSPDKKIDLTHRKKILQDTFQKILPSEIYHRPKHGFEVPLLDIFRNELKSFIFDGLLSDEFLKEQGIFNIKQIQLLRKKLLSSNPEDVSTHLWSLMVFQNWYKKYMS